MPNFFVPAVPETTSSRSAPPTLMPAMPLAAFIFPSTIHPPPTPVETVMYTSEVHPLPAPYVHSPSPASAPSLTSWTFAFNAFDISCAICIPSQARRFRALDMTPSSLIVPATQPANAVILSLPAHASANSTNVLIPSVGSLGVGTFLISPSESPETAATRFWVPPMSATIYMEISALGNAAKVDLSDFFVQWIFYQRGGAVFLNNIVRKAAHLFDHFIIS